MTPALNQEFKNHRFSSKTMMKFFVTGLLPICISYDDLS